MRELNWNIFELKFNGKQQAAFQRMSYFLFCSKFSIRDGLFEHKDQVGIETEPIENNGEWIGFQAKYLGPSISFSSYKNKFIDSLEKAKDKNPMVSIIYFYVNKTFSESSKKGKKTSQYIAEIEKKAKELKIKIIWQVPSQIEKQLSNTENLFITNEFFPEFLEQELKNSNQEKLLDVSRTALIQVELAKIKFDFTYDWSKSDDLFNKFYIYVDFRNEIIAREVLSFLNIHVSAGARFQMPASVASEIQGLVLTYFPSSYDDEQRELRIENGKECIYTGFHLAYDALIYTGNYSVAKWGLSIWKFIYRESKRKGYIELTDLVLKQYEELEHTLNRPERNDLGNAKELVKIFKDDLETYDFFPVLPRHLYELTQKSY